MSIDENKPSWSTAPEWANFLTRDNKGDWSWFECEPSFNEVTMRYEADGGMVHTMTHGVFYTKVKLSRPNGTGE